MKIKSNYLGVDVDIDIYEGTTEQGNEMPIVTHNSLENVILNNLPPELGVKWDLIVEDASDTHPVVKCTMLDNNGRRVQAIGEAVANTLVNEIARNFPVTMAGNRAFDRAAIKYLALETNGKMLYSSEEIPTAKRKWDNNSSATPANNTVKVEEVPQNIEEELPVEEPVEETPTPTVETISATSVGPGDVMINFGKFEKNPVTVKWAYENDKNNWFSYMVENFTANTPEKQAIIEAMREYAKSVRK